MQNMHKFGPAILHLGICPEEIIMQVQNNVDARIVDNEKIVRTTYGGDK